MRDLDPAALERLVTRALGAPPSDVTPMRGGASTRRFLRVRAGGRSAVAMFFPDSKSEEATTFAGAASSAAPARWPFLEIRDLLADRGVRVPALLGEACDDGLLLVEDLGDETLGRFLERAPERRVSAYTTAVRDLARAQRTLADLPAGSVVATRAFDEALLRWELDHFRQWGLDARDRALAPAERACLDAIFDRLARRIAALSRGFVHRDYQSTNLMVVGAPAAGDAAIELCWIDFQDALLGPRVYDLVALLNDSYQDLERPFVEARLDDFAKEAGLSADERAELGHEFDLVTVQRKLKDAGRFVFIDRVKHNPAFLRFFEPSLVKVRAALERLAPYDEDMRDLSALVAHA